MIKIENPQTRRKRETWTREASASSEIDQKHKRLMISSDSNRIAFADCTLALHHMRATDWRVLKITFERCAGQL